MAPACIRRWILSFDSCGQLLIDDGQMSSTTNVPRMNAPSFSSASSSGSVSSSLSQRGSFNICLSRLETTILTPSGDVLVCRGRDFARRSDRRDLQTTRNGLCAIDANSFCDVCVNVNGSHQNNENANGSSGTGYGRGQIQLDNESAKENYNDLSAPPSFDYSNYEPAIPIADKQQPRHPLAQVPEQNGSENEDGFVRLFGSLLSSPNGASEHQHHPKKEPENPMTSDALSTPTVLHGVPTCLMREIRISAISANALGSHVLLISTQALLFSYGSNTHGQLGLGTSELFVPTPTLVTAVLEGGGKTLHCSAGVDYSLICVKTRQRRTQKNSGDALSQGASDFYLHQLYGFGSNKGKKLGLYKNASEMNVTLPHRIALHAKVTWPSDANEKSSQQKGFAALPVGIFCLAASSNHSAALIRSATGAVDLFLWGESGALGLASDSGAITKVESLSFNPALVDDEDSYLMPSEYPSQVALGVNCTFVLLNTGRCLSFGGSHLLPEKVCLEPTEVELDSRIVSLSVGSQHVLATCVGQKVYSWGVDPATHTITARPLEVGKRAIQTFAGHDASAFVLEDGTVQTCGASSGRLGQGEVPPNPKKPTAVFGGLRLWR